MVLSSLSLLSLTSLHHYSQLSGTVRIYIYAQIVYFCLYLVFSSTLSCFVKVVFDTLHSEVSL